MTEATKSAYIAAEEPDQPATPPLPDDCGPGRLNRLRRRLRLERHAGPPLTLRWRIFIYFLIFTLIMVVFLWLFQIVYLDTFYERVKKQQIEAAYSAIALNINREDLRDYVNNVAVHFNLCIRVYALESEAGLVYGAQEAASADLLGDCIIHHVDDQEIARFYREAKAAENDGFMEIFTRVRFGAYEAGDQALPQFAMTKDEGLSKSLVYARLTKNEAGDTYFLLLNSSITPVTATVATLRIQLIITTALLVVMALVISLLIARRLSRPISRLNAAAKRLAAGDLTGNFPAGSYPEISELAQTLNYAAAELSRTDTLQKELIANISHDIRTPLTMIAGYAEYMRDFPAEDHRESVDVIVGEVDRLRGLVNDILDVSRISAGVSKLHVRIFDFSESLTGFISNYNHLIEPQGYHIRLDALPEAWISGDEGRLLQAVGNMLNNALSHIGPDKLIIVRQSLEGDMMRLEVGDHGCGIAPEDLPHIWERYYRTGPSPAGHSGSGLGLSIVAGILRQHGARYGVRSKVGEGSTFWFELKIAPADPATLI
ncbi:MAG: HAMP domain-containing histidine kinase [Clostridia bacterium]|nr:HAMP domain-containing histidine kinase [Clostridia bacterium]